MPEAQAGYAAPTSAATKEFFYPFFDHDQATFVYPTLVTQNEDNLAFFVLPHDFTVLSVLEVWFIPNTTSQNIAHDITVNAGTCGEAKNTHTENITPNINFTQNVYNCYDLLAALSTIPALLNAKDMLEIYWKVTGSFDVLTLYGVRYRY